MQIESDILSTGPAESQVIVTVRESGRCPQGLEARFDEAMMRIYLRAKAEVGYNATRYLQMLHDLRGLETARVLIRADQASEGYTALWERGRLDLTVEALVLQPEWNDLFASEPDVLEAARRRLTSYGFKT